MERIIILDIEALEDKDSFLHLSNTILTQQVLFISQTTASLFRHMVDFLGAKVVVAGNWKQGKTVDEVAEALLFYGVINTEKQLGGVLPDSKTGDLGEEVYHWIERNGVSINDYLVVAPPQLGSIGVANILETEEDFSLESVQLIANFFGEDYQIE